MDILVVWKLHTVLWLCQTTGGNCEQKEAYITEQLLT
jgi:hypothetical protein